MTVPHIAQDIFEQAVASFYGGDTERTAVVMGLASRARQGTTSGIYIPKDPYRRRPGPETPFDRFKSYLDEIGEDGIVPYLCQKFPSSKVKITKRQAGYGEKVALTPGDDTRVTAELEKYLKRAVGQTNFPLAKAEFLRLRPFLPKDESGQIVKKAMQMIIVGFQIHALDVVIEQSYAPDEDGKAGGGPPEKITKQKKELAHEHERIMKLLGLTYDDITKRVGSTGGDLASAAEALKETIGESIATADVLAESREVHAREKQEEDGTAPAKIDPVDMASIMEPAVIDDDHSDSRGIDITPLDRSSGDPD